MNRSLAGLTLLLAATPVFAWGNDCEFSATREVSLGAPRGQPLAVLARAGDLTVRGEASLNRVIATGKACASSQALLDEIRLTAGKDGADPAVRVEMPDLGNGWGGWGSSYASLDLEVRVPTGTALRVDDSSGDARIEAIAALEVNDSSGDLDIRDVAGAVTVEDNSGDVDVRSVGSVHVRRDNSGDLDIADVRGDVVIDRDSSGDIDVADVRGDATVDTDSSGDIEFKRIAGSARVDRDSSGGIYADHIGGDFVVRSDGSGGIHHTGVTGRIDVPAED